MYVESQLDKNSKLKNIIVLTVLFALIIICLTGITVAVLYRSEIRSYYSELKVRGSDSIERQRGVIFQYFNSVLPDLLFFSQQNELISLLNSGESEWAELAGKEYIKFAKVKNLYDQITYIDKKGREIIQINIKDDRVTATKNEDLQERVNQDYFTESIALNRGEIFVSRLDLDIDQQDIETPYKPVIRLATPVFDDSGVKHGIVILNCNAQRLLDNISYYADPETGRLMLCNSDGYWLISPDFDDEWGFILGERRDRNFKVRYTEEWGIIQNSKGFQFETGNGFFNFSKIFPFLETLNAPENITGSIIQKVKKPDPSKYYWILITHIPPESMQITKNKIFSKYLYLLAIILVILIPVAFVLAAGIVRRREYSARLLNMALHDILTELPNRRYFMERLTESIEHARRFNRKMGLLYIDLDGFKEVNDTKGHDAGDELLRKIADKLRQTTRTADIAARLGGDEFAIILFEVDSTDGALNAGNHCLLNLDTDFQLKAGTVKIHASVGVAVYPDHGSAPDEIIDQADKAMYYSKMTGKNRCSLAHIKK